MKILILILGFLGSDCAVAAKIFGDSEPDMLFGTPEADTFYGGDGSDTFVINFLSDEPDEILDFDPEEGDRIELTFPEVRRLEFESGLFKVNSRGVVTLTLEGTDLPVVDTRRAGIQLQLDQRKGRYFLKFELPTGGR